MVARRRRRLGDHLLRELHAAAGRAAADLGGGDGGQLGARAVLLLLRGVGPRLEGAGADGLGDLPGLLRGRRLVAPNVGPAVEHLRRAERRRRRERTGQHVDLAEGLELSGRWAELAPRVGDAVDDDGVLAAVVRADRRRVALVAAALVELPVRVAPRVPVRGVLAGRRVQADRVEARGAYRASVAPHVARARVAPGADVEIVARGLPLALLLRMLRLLRRLRRRVRRRVRLQWLLLLLLRLLLRLRLVALIPGTGRVGAAR